MNYIFVTQSFVWSTDRVSVASSDMGLLTEDSLLTIQFNWSGRLHVTKRDETRLDKVSRGGCSYQIYSQGKKATIHQLTAMLATSKNVLFTGHNHLRWWPDTLIIARAPAAGSAAPVVSRWLWPGNRTFLEVASMVATWWIVAFLRSVSHRVWSKDFHKASGHH